MSVGTLGFLALALIFTLMILRSRKNEENKSNAFSALAEGFGMAAGTIVTLIYAVTGVMIFVLPLLYLFGVL